MNFHGASGKIHEISTSTTSLFHMDQGAFSRTCALAFSIRDLWDEPAVGPGGSWKMMHKHPRMHRMYGPYVPNIPKLQYIYI